jgi:hypothetical protein
MMWQKKTPYCIVSGEYKIAKFFCDEGSTLYLASKGNETIGYFEDSDSAKQACEDKHEPL